MSDPKTEAEILSLAEETYGKLRTSSLRDDDAISIIESALRTLTPSQEPVMDREALGKIREQLLTQDNRCTSNPMFCVQIKVRDIGYDSNYCDDRCWRNDEQDETVYKEPENLDGWDEFGYRDRWETVMVCFTEQGCKDYLAVNGHNVRSRAHTDEVRIYVESYYRNHEMIEVRNALLATQFALSIQKKEGVCVWKFSKNQYTSGCVEGRGVATQLSPAAMCWEFCPFCSNKIQEQGGGKV